MGPMGVQMEFAPHWPLSSAQALTGSQSLPLLLGDWKLSRHLQVYWFGAVVVQADEGPQMLAFLAQGSMGVQRPPVPSRDSKPSMQEQVAALGPENAHKAFEPQ